jgi:hypothetical protein
VRRGILKKKFLWMLPIVAVVASGCATVSPWERDRLSLESMKLQDSECHRFERNGEVYREGAVGANGGKSGGGCGCT